MKKELLVKIRQMALVFVLPLISLTAFGQSSVSGVITDGESGSGLPGVTILEKGTTNGTISDVNGNYTINVGSGATLVFSFVGYETQEVAVGNQRQINVNLASDIQSLEEIVVVGYTTQSKGDITGAVATANVENIQKLPGGNVASMLQGQVPGVISTPGSGAPGSEPVIRIRGLGTIGNNQPLFVIDGIPGEYSSINPADIESLTVLKDASAATIYGSRAANGVVIITTKRGKTGKPQLTFNSYIAASNITKKMDVLNTAQLNEVGTAAHAADGLDAPGYATVDGAVDTDWQDEMYRTGFEQKYDVGISGGTDYNNYNFSFGYISDEGTIIGTDFERFNIRLNSDYKIGNRLTVGQTISYARSNRNLIGESEGESRGNAGFSPILDILSSLPHNATLDPNTADGYAVPVVGNGNVLGTTELVTNYQEKDYVQGNAYVEIDLFEGLKFRSRIGANIYNNYFLYHAPTYAFGSQGTNELANLSETRTRTTEVIWNNVLDYKRTFGDHTVSVLAGQSSERRDYNSTGGSNNHLPSNKLMALDAGIGDANSWGTNVTRTISSLFAQANYSFQNKYLLGASIRRDGSSRFGSENKYGTFPSVSVGWRVSEEGFFNVGWISEFKPRFSIGKLGNQNIGDYLFLSTIESNSNKLNYPLGSADSQEVSIGSIGTSLSSEDIKWEESTTTDIGVDLGFIEDRIGLTFDYFITNTTDMLVGLPIPYTTGITVSPTVNGGAMENKGWEVALSYRQREGNFTWDLTGNMTSSKNTVTELGFAGEAFTDGHVIFDTHPTTRTEVGGEIGRFYLFETAGLFQTEEEVAAWGTQPNAQPGDLKFVDANGDGVLNDDDKQFMGSGLAKLNYGLTFNAQYQQFDFSLFFEGSHGGKIYNGGKVLLYRRQADDKNFSTDLLDAWSPSNTGSDIPRVTVNDPNGNIRPSDYFLEDGSYLRLKNIQIGYSIPNLSSNGGSMRVYVSGENLLTITGYSGYDPGVTNYSQFSRGVDRGLYPLSNNLILGLQFNF